ncbi:MAG TPA: FKBP-type peptidyl-prolyl cis-trans isomerase [Opitutaceae bacterium]|nr:FKBP-type peptidyl-prolyl cis-trans isomerase [Opitutaceae bacterium]
MFPIRYVAALCALVSAPALLHAQREKLTLEDLDYVEKTWPQAKISNTGIRYVVEREGKGPLLMPGDMVMVHYVGKLLNGKVFDQNHDDLHPFTFRVGRGFVIVGWDQILQLMRPGDNWLVIIPAELAYGRKGSPPKIPGDSTLVFDIEVIGIKKDA